MDKHHRKNKVNLSELPDTYIAFNSDKKIIAHSGSLERVFQLALLKGEPAPYVAHSSIIKKTKLDLYR